MDFDLSLRDDASGLQIEQMQSDERTNSPLGAYAPKDVGRLGMLGSSIASSNRDDMSLRTANIEKVDYF